MSISRIDIVGYCSSQFDEESKVGLFSNLVVNESTGKVFSSCFRVKNTTGLRVRLMSIATLVNSFSLSKDCKYKIRIHDPILGSILSNPNMESENVDSEPNIDIILSFMNGIGRTNCILTKCSKKHKKYTELCDEILKNPCTITDVMDRHAEGINIK